MPLCKHWLLSFVWMKSVSSLVKSFPLESGIKLCSIASLILFSLFRLCLFTFRSDSFPARTWKKRNDSLRHRKSAQSLCNGKKINTCVSDPRLTHHAQAWDCVSSQTSIVFKVVANFSHSAACAESISSSPILWTLHAHFAGLSIQSLSEA